jgi:hypothetical protein
VRDRERLEKHINGLVDEEIYFWKSDGDLAPNIVFEEELSD